MEGIGLEEQRYRQSSYSGYSVPDHRRSLTTAGSMAHGPNPSPSAPPNSWPPQPSVVAPPTSVSMYERPPSAPSHIPPPQPYSSYPPPRGEYAPPSTAPPYSRSESISTPRRSPVDVANVIHPPPPPATNGQLAEGPPPGDYYGSGDYRNRPPYAPMELSPSQKPSHPPPMPGPREAIPNPPSGPPPAPTQPTSQAPQQHMPTYPLHPPPPQPHQISIGPGSGPGPGNRMSPITYEPTAPPQYWAPMTAQQPFPPRPRGHRAQHACESCRTRKAKCDEGKPTCGHCAENSLTCNYRDLQPQKQEKAGQAQMELLNLLNQNMMSLMQGFNEMKSVITGHEKVISKLRAGDPEAEAELEVEPPGTMTRPDPELGLEPQQKIEQLDSPKAEYPIHPLPSFDPPQPTKSDGNNTAPTDHTTAAHEMLSWPSIKLLLKDKVPNKDYVAQGEWSRGLLRLCGYGEGENKDDTVRGAASPAGSVVSSNSDDQSAASPDIVWGFDLETGPSGREAGGIPEDHPGVLGADGKLKLDSDTIDRYVHSYMCSMYVMHPILDPRRFRAMINKFKQSYSPQRPHPALGKRKRDGDARFYHPADINQRQGNERDYIPPRYPKLARTISNAIIVLVLALGKICTHKDALPGPLRGNPSQGATSTPCSQPATLRSSSAVSSMQNSPSMPQAMPQPMSTDNYSTPSNDGVPGIRNMDVIPGLAYFAWAISVLGEHIGGSDLEHCQAFILAALYWGQLAHPFSSYAWIVQASSAVIGLVHSRSIELLTRVHKFPQSASMSSRMQVDLIEICYWTCLQLESDLRAELKELQPSGISKYEEFMEGNQFHPSGTVIDGTNTGFDNASIAEYYLFQLYLRKHLNRTHSEFYDPRTMGKDARSVPVIRVLLDSLEGYRGVFGARRWRDGDPPAKDILAARLRAKFYGGRNIVIRPLLEDIMKEEFNRAEQNPRPTSSPSPMISGPHSQPHSPAIAQLKHQNRIARQQYEARLPQHHAFSQSLSHAEIPPLDDEKQALARLGIQSLIESTIAFDDVEPKGQRLIVTNIFGTLHAQFGNMLILAAACQSPRLKRYVDRDQLDHLMKRTINVLFSHRHISPTLREDARILDIIQQNLPPVLNSGDSFSSHDT